MTWKSFSCEICKAEYIKIKETLFSLVDLEINSISIISKIIIIIQIIIIIAADKIKRDFFSSKQFTISWIFSFSLSILSFKYVYGFKLFFSNLSFFKFWHLIFTKASIEDILFWSNNNSSKSGKSTLAKGFISLISFFERYNCFNCGNLTFYNILMDKD